MVNSAQRIKVVVGFSMFWFIDQSPKSYKFFFDGKNGNAQKPMQPAQCFRRQPRPGDMGQALKQPWGVPVMLGLKMRDTSQR